MTDQYKNPGCEGCGHRFTTTEYALDMERDRHKCGHPSRKTRKFHAVEGPYTVYPDCDDVNDKGQCEFFEVKPSWFTRLLLKLFGGWA